MSCYKYIILTDLDGTLLNKDKCLSEATVKFVHQLNKRNDILFSFSTGRSWDRCKDIYYQLDLKGFVSCGNSSHIINPREHKSFYYFLSKKVLHEIFLSKLVAENLIRTKLLSDKLTIDVSKENLLEFLNSLNDIQGDVFTIRLFFPSDCLHTDKLIDLIKSIKPSLKLTIFLEKGAINFEIQAGFVTKEFAVKYFSDYYGVETHNILTFGDNYNDISVFEGSSSSCVVANAPMFIKQLAKKVSNYTNDEDAVVQEIQKFLKME